MSDELERMLRKTPAQSRPTIAGPRLHTAPRVRGGPSLDGGPKLEMGIPLEAIPPAAKPVGTEAKTTTPSLGGPHLPTPLPETARRPLATPLASPTWHIPSAAHAFQLEAVGLQKVYRKGGVDIPVLQGVSLSIRPGEFLAVVGQSGSGKSTLLHLLGTLDAPDAGTISFAGRRIDNLRGRERDTLRNRHLGMVFQFYHLLPELTTLENVLSPLMIQKSLLSYFRHRKSHQATATRLLEMVGLGHRLKHRPAELSGGEMQRAAIARALVTGPQLLLADEPTGNLDQKTGQEILTILRSLNRQEKLTIVMVTHDLAIAAQADRMVRLVDGQIAAA